MDKLQEHAGEVANFLKGFANKHRLLILCQLCNGEKNVTELIEATGIAQTSMSQHLSKLKTEGLVDFRRDHRTLYYYIKDGTANRLMELLYNRFCE